MIIIKKCSYCSRDFSFKSEGKRNDKRKYCSLTCSSKNPKKRSISKWYEKSKQKSIDTDKNIQEIDFESLSYDLRKRRVISDQNGSCMECGNDTWRGKPMTLEIEHIDGDHTNNKRENVIALCPNCHSYTPTWRGRNKSKNKITDIQMYTMIQNSKSIHQALLNLGMSAKGKNYERAQRVISLFSGESGGT